MISNNLFLVDLIAENISFNLLVIFLGKNPNNLRNTPNRGEKTNTAPKSPKPPIINPALNIYPELPFKI